MTLPNLSHSRARKPVLADGRTYAPFLAELREEAVEVVYAIYDARGRCLYVGESHSGRFGQAYDTITRHFRQWGIDARTDATGRRRGGTMYHRDRVRLVFARVPSGTAIDTQTVLIEQLVPEDNVAFAGAQ